MEGSTKRKVDHFEITEVEGDVTNVEIEIASITKDIQDREGRINSIEQNIILVEQKLEDNPTDDLREKLKSLRGDKETIQTIINSLLADKTLLREKEILLRRNAVLLRRNAVQLRDMELLRLKKKALTEHEPSTDPSTSQSIIDFTFEQLSASSFTAGKSKHLSVCALSVCTTETPLLHSTTLK